MPKDTLNKTINLQKDLDVEINEGAVEPKDYFKILKKSKKKTTEENLQKQLNILAENIILAKQAGQKNYIERLSFTYDVILKEQNLLKHKIDTFVYKDDIKNFLDKVTPKNSIKIIELERYPRSIPLDILKKIKTYKDLNLFDEYAIVFTDFTENSHTTKKEKEFLDRNRDPVIFGFFKHNETGLFHERFYYIDDWEDEYCDLSFTKMIEKMSQVGIKEPDHKISYDSDYLNEIVQSTLKSMKDQNSSNTHYTAMNPVKTKNKSFWQKFKTWFE